MITFRINVTETMSPEGAAIVVLSEIKDENPTSREKQFAVELMPKLSEVVSGAGDGFDSARIFRSMNGKTLPNETADSILGDHVPTSHVLSAADILLNLLVLCQVVANNPRTSNPPKLIDASEFKTRARKEYNRVVDPHKNDPTKATEAALARALEIIHAQGS